MSRLSKFFVSVFVVLFSCTYSSYSAMKKLPFMNSSMGCRALSTNRLCKHHQITGSCRTSALLSAFNHPNYEGYRFIASKIIIYGLIVVKFA
jgi:hypothetical protein